VLDADLVHDAENFNRVGRVQMVVIIDSAEARFLRSSIRSHECGARMKVAERKIDLRCGAHKCDELVFFRRRFLLRDRLRCTHVFVAPVNRVSDG